MTTREREIETHVIMIKNLLAQRGTRVAKLYRLEQKANALRIVGAPTATRERIAAAERDCRVTEEVVASIDRQIDAIAAADPEARAIVRQTWGS